MSEYPILDVERALEHTGGDRELLAQLCAVFLDECPAELQEVAAAVASGSPLAIERTAHKLKGSTSVLGGLQASEAALRLERVAAGSAEQIGTGFEALQFAVGALVDRLRQLVAEIDAGGPGT